MEKSLTVDSEHAGARVDKILTAKIEGLGRAAARKLFDAGKVRLNGKRVSKGDVAREGDKLTVELVDAAGPGAVPEPDAALSVMMETELVVVVEKPAGQPTAPLSMGETGTLANALVGHYPEMAALGYAPREPGLIHRLDTDTSGLVLAARTARAFAALSTALKEGRIRKTYLLLCASEGLAERGTIDIPLAHHPKDRRKVYACVHPRDVVRYAPRNATTSFRVLQLLGDFALVEASAATAMRHQIRAHMAATGHPLAGDTLYGGPEVPGLTRHVLHASSILWEGSPDVPAFEVRSALPEAVLALFAT